MWRIAPLIAVLAAGALALASGGDAKPSCGTVQHGVLPAWARTGFSDPKPRIAHVLGHQDRIVAILFGGLHAPPDADAGNKILWVARRTPQSPTDLKITARKGRTTVTRVVAGGPGPSGIDLPSPGCWHMTLRWAGTSDSLELRYAQGKPAKD